MLANDMYLIFAVKVQDRLIKTFATCSAKLASHLFDLVASSWSFREILSDAVGVCVWFTSRSSPYQRENTR